MSENVRIVVFDLGGVVVRICRSWEEACRRAGIPIREPERFVDDALRQRRKAITAEYMRGKMACEEYFGAISDATDGLYSADEVRQIHDIWLIEDYPGIGGLIERITSTPGLVTACLSNTNHAHWRALTVGESASSAITGLQHRLVSHEMGAVKPDDEIYRGAERMLAAGAEEIIFFDDTEEHVLGARACGWRAEQIDPHADTAPQIERHLDALGIVLDS